MITIYVEGSATLEPAAAGQLRHLADAGHELVLVAAATHPATGLVGWAGHLPALPEEPAAGSWFVTADPATCGDRRSNFRTILVGPRATGPRPTRCDATARDLREAVLAILASDAMH